MITQKQKIRIKELCDKYSVANLYVFGSILSDSHNPESDIDFLINFSTDLSIDEYSDNYFNLHLELQQIFNKKVDLITERSLKNPYLIESIKSNRELIYNAA